VEAAFCLATAFGRILNPNADCVRQKPLHTSRKSRRIKFLFEIGGKDNDLTHIHNRRWNLTVLTTPIGMGDCHIGFSSGFSQWVGAEIELDDLNGMWYNKRRSIPGQL
jgi:hypothetical protein